MKNWLLVALVSFMLVLGFVAGFASAKPEPPNVIFQSPDPPPIQLTQGYLIPAWAMKP